MPSGDPSIHLKHRSSYHEWPEANPPPTTEQFEEASLLRTVGFIFAIGGWIFFVVMVALLLSGATIYATSEQSVIRQIDPIWELSDKDTDSKDGTHIRFKILGSE